MKPCIKCNSTYPLSEFYKHPKMPDGTLNKCKKCCREDSKLNMSIKMSDPNFVIKEKERQLEKDRRLYRKTTKPLRERLPKIHTETWRNYFEKYPEKYKARNISQYITPIVHGNHLHHWSYKTENAKDVIEMSAKDHYVAHKNLIYNQSEMCYMTMEGVLLDSRDKHVGYLITIGIIKLKALITSL